MKNKLFKMTSIFNEIDQYLKSKVSEDIDHC